MRAFREARIRGVADHEALANARGRVDDQIKAVERASSSRDLAQEPAKLAAFSNRELTEALLVHAETLSELGGRLAERVDRNSDRFVQELGRFQIQLAMLTTQIQVFTRTANEGTNRLAKWTMVLAIVTGLLTIAAFVQAYTVWSAPAPQIIVTPPEAAAGP